MEATLILGGVNAALSLLEQFGPALETAIKKGEITVEQQAAVQARIESLRNGSFFLSPQWRISSSEPDTQS